MIIGSRKPIGLVLAHGGAGEHQVSSAQRHAMTRALEEGGRLLVDGRPALDIVEATIRILEASGRFNAGSGSYRQLDHVVRMDASLMEGASLRAGAVAGVENVAHPVAAARLVMEQTAHVLLTGPPASQLARYFNLKGLIPGRVGRRRPARRLTPEERGSLRLARRMGMMETVGAVAVDRDGTVAAGASTGGVAMMLPGRVGDTPLIGCGVYADNRGGAVSMTGRGEGIIRLVMAKAIVDRLVKGESPIRASGAVLRELVARIQGAAGALVLAADGGFAIRHTTSWMCGGYVRPHKRPVVRDAFNRVSVK